MKVYLRSVNEGTSFYFTKYRFYEIEDVIAMLKRGGGVYCEGSTVTDLSFQYVLDPDDAYAEIINRWFDAAMPSSLPPPRAIWRGER